MSKFKVCVDLDVVIRMSEVAQCMETCTGLDLSLAMIESDQLNNWFAQVPRVFLKFADGEAVDFRPTLVDQKFAWIDWGNDDPAPYYTDGTDVSEPSWGAVMLTDEQRKTWILQQIHFVVSEIQKRDGAFGLPITDEEYKTMDLSSLERILNELKQLAKLPPSR